MDTPIAITLAALILAALGVVYNRRQVKIGQLEAARANRPAVVIEPDAIGPGRSAPGQYEWAVMLRNVHPSITAHQVTLIGLIDGAETNAAGPVDLVPPPSLSTAAMVGITFAYEGTADELREAARFQARDLAGNTWTWPDTS